MKNINRAIFTRTFLTLTTCFYIGQAFPQSYYPGGLGNTNLIVWLNANHTASITKNGANQVSQWADLSGNGFLFTQGTTANMPVYGAAAAPNGRAALGFTATSSQYLSLASLPNTISLASGISNFFQGSFSGKETNYGWERVYDFGNGQANNNFMFGRYSNTQDTYVEGWTGGAGDQTWTTTSNIVNGSSNMYESVQQGAAPGNYTSVAQYMAGASQAVSGAAGSKTWVPQSVTRTKNYIGRSNWATDDYFNGTMSEVLIYNTAFNTTQRVIMENYLAAEWAQAVSVTKYTPPSATTYGTNLVGIGYTSAADRFLTNPSGSTDGLGFSSGTGGTDFLNSAGYLMAAHNGQSNTVISPATISGVTSATSISRWNRSWDVQKTGGNATGAVTLNFNFSDYSGTTPSALNSYALLYNATDGTFASGSNIMVNKAPTVSGNIVSFVVNANNLANGYYTIIWSSTILPVGLTGFTAARQENSSLIKWSVAQETNIDHYEIQRWVNGANPSTIGSVAANNSGTRPGEYSFTDSKPETGKNFYRLKIVDRDGVSAYSSVASVDFAAARSISINIYPNPVANRLHIGFTDAVDVISVLVVNTRGQVVRTVRSGASDGVDIPVNDLSRGIYIVQVDAGDAKYVQKIMKN